MEHFEVLGHPAAAHVRADGLLRVWVGARDRPARMGCLVRALPPPASARHGRAAACSVLLQHPECAAATDLAADTARRLAARTARPVMLSFGFGAEDESPAAIADALCARMVSLCGGAI